MIVVEVDRRAARAGTYAPAEPVKRSSNQVCHSRAPSFAGAQPRIRAAGARLGRARAPDREDSCDSVPARGDRRSPLPASPAGGRLDRQPCLAAMATSLLISGMALVVAACSANTRSGAATRAATMRMRAGCTRCRQSALYLFRIAPPVKDQRARDGWQVPHACRESSLSGNVNDGLMKAQGRGAQSITNARLPSGSRHGARTAEARLGQQLVEAEDPLSIARARILATSGNDRKGV